MRRVVVYAVLAQAVLTVTWVNATWGQEPTEGQESIEKPTPGSVEVWIVSVGRESTGRATLHVGFQETFDVPAPIVFEWEIVTESDIGGCTVLMTVVDPSGDSVFGAETDLVLGLDSVERGAFTWDSRQIPLGELEVHFQLFQASGQELAVETLIINSFSVAEVQRDLEEARAAIGSLREHVASVESEIRISPYVGMRLSIADDFLKWAQSDRLNSNELRHIAAYGLRIVESLRARLSFSSVSTEASFGAPGEPGLASIQIEDGTFVAEGLPVFLAGMILNGNEADQVARLARYGLNLAVVERQHAELRPTYSQVRDQLAPVFRAAQRHNISVAVQLVSPPGAGGALGADARPSDILALMRPSTRAYSEYLSERPYTHSLILDRRPRFLLGGDLVVELFRTAVERDFVDRFTLNRHWRTRLASFEEVDIWRDYSRPSYQFDWQTFHRDRGTEIFTLLQEAVAEEAPTLIAQVALADDSLTPGASQYGIDHEELSALFPVSGLAIQGSPSPGGYGIEMPGERMLYTLARSFNPGNPVFNAALAPTRNRALHELNLFEFVHTRIWEGAIEGLSAIALAAPDPRNPGRPSYLNQPEALEGFATANMDINRLLRVVLAFQRAPARLAILWSDSARIYEDGDAFLPSVMNAYEGVSTSGLKVRFLTESQCRNGGLAGIDLLVIPNTPALDNEAMDAVEAFNERGGFVIRAAKPIPYSARGESRTHVVRFDQDTLLVRGTGRASEYLHAMDAALSQGYVASRPRAINEFGYPLEGVRTRYVEVEGMRYLYIVNLRNTSVLTHLFGPFSSGIDLIRGESISFPTTLQALRPMLIQLDAPKDNAESGGDALELSTPEMVADAEASAGFARRVEVRPLESGSSKPQ